MELQQLRYFQSVARTESMTQSASDLHISQPALSKSIRLLEEELSEPLFDRHGKHIWLNEYGRIFLNYVNTCLQALEKGKSELKIYRREKESTITLLMNTALTTLPDLASGFKKLHPDISLNLWKPESLTDGSTYDFSLDVHQLPIKDRNHLTVLSENVLAAISRLHPLANKKTLNIADLAGESFVSLPGSTTFRRIMDAYCLQNGIEHHVVCEAYDYRNSFELVKRNVGIAFFPELTWTYCPTPDPEVVLIPITPVCSRHLILSWHEDKVFSPILREFRSYLLIFFTELTQKNISINQLS